MGLFLNELDLIAIFGRTQFVAALVGEEPAGEDDRNQSHGQQRDDYEIDKADFCALGGIGGTAKETPL